MNIKVLFWKEDLAAKNIVENLAELGLGDLLIQSPKSLLFTNQKELEKNVQNLNEVDFFIIASTHRSEAKKISLTVHPSGNFGPAGLGGNQAELSKTLPAALKIGVQYFAKNAPEGVDAAMEATHHGPTDWEKPLLFIEIGSTEKEWVRKDLGVIVAKAIKEICEKAPNANFENYIGFGGIHYCPSFSTIQIENEKIAIGHVMAKYASEFITEDLVKQMLEKSSAKTAVIDWKGIKSEGRNKVVDILKELGVEFFKTSEMHSQK